MSGRRLLAVLGIAVSVTALCMPLHARAESSASSTENVHDAADVEKRVRKLFEDAPVMAEIARCESRFRQYADSGNPLRGGWGGGMIGVFQFNEAVHTDAAASLGFDLETLDGNLGYARHMYDRSGTDPWISSIGCWNVKNDTEDEEDDERSSGSKSLNIDLSFGQSHPQVKTLQRLLNAAGFTISEEGPGSPGNETDMFGSLTRAAVRKFQCDKKIACSGDEYSTSYGYVGAKTRAALLKYEGKEPKSKQSRSKTTETPKADVSTSGMKTDAQAEREAKIAEIIRLIAELQRLLAEIEEA